MWTRTHTAVFNNVAPEAIWRVWTDVDHWHEWDSDIEYCRLKGPFEVGQKMELKPKGASSVEIELTQVEPLFSYTDCTHFFGAKMYGRHEMKKEKDGLLRLTTTMTVTGVLGFVWRKLVAQGIVDTLGEQTEALVRVARANG